MLPSQQSGIATACKMLFSKFSKETSGKKSIFGFRMQPGNTTTFKKFTPVNPFQAIFKRIESTLNQMKKGNEREDYYKVINSHIPKNTKLLLPQYPANSRDIQLADLDGDSRDELIASYGDSEGIKTIVLKNQNGRWEKISEIRHSEYNSLKYRNIKDIAGNGKKQLLLGLNSEGKRSRLFGYSFEGNKESQLFDLNYHKFEVLRQQQNRSGSSNAQLAVWNRKENNEYDIQVLNWNGTQLEPVESPTTYYYRNVTPYYARKVKQNPYSSSNWYNLADSLLKAGAKRDALTAVDVGMSLTRDTVLQGKFTVLKDKIKV